MEYEIKWDDGAVAGSHSRAHTLAVDSAHNSRHCGFIDVFDIHGVYLDYCAYARFGRTLHEDEWHDAMQTVLMMAKARYGL